MRTLIAVPTTGSMNYRFVESLLKLRRVGDAVIDFHPSSLIYDARNALAGRAVMEEFDYVLWLDSDMVFPEDTMERLMAGIGTADAITAIYHTRRVPFKPLIYKECGYQIRSAGEIVPVADEWYEHPTEGVFDVAACGFGCVLTRVSALKKVKDEQGLPFSPLLGFGEDLSFCLKLRKCGGRIVCDPTINVGHIAEIVIDADTRERWVNVLKDEVIKAV